MESKVESPVISIRSIGYGYDISLEELISTLDTDINNGLSSVEVKSRIQELGKNEIVTPKPSFWRIYISPLLDVLIRVYLIMIAIMLVLGIWVEGIISEITFWLVMISFNMVLAIFQQFRAQKKIDALLKLSPPKATVKRDGKPDEIHASELVPGDIITLSVGDKIPADARIIQSSSLMLNEASLTGESVPVSKSSDGKQIISGDTPISKLKTMLYMGTFVQMGSGKAIVTHTGNNTELGKIASAMSEMQVLEIPLRNRINAFGKRISIVMLAFLFVKLIIAIITQVMEGSFSFETLAIDTKDSILVAMSVIPINIPLLVTVILIGGVLNMASKGVIVKELSVVETLGRCSVLCSDKTGTITLSEMHVKLIWDTKNYYGVSTNNEHQQVVANLHEDDTSTYLNLGTNQSSKVSKVEPGSTLELIMTSAILNNDAKLVPSDPTKKNSNDFQIIGNPTDGALLVLATTQGFNQDSIRERYLFDRNYPFDSSLKRMSGIFKDVQENDYMVFSKGATETIISRCTHIGDETNIRVLEDEDKKIITSKINQFAQEGYRVISLAYRSLQDLPPIFDHNEGTERDFFERDLTYIGFTVIHDPPRTGVKDAVANLDSAGIFPIMITGDAPTTAATIAKQVGILDPEEIVVLGKQSAILSDEDFFKVSVFARVSPQDKEVIVSRYQNRGDVVAMTGDGVNDALAITKSDAGVAMGITGTEVAKESADLIISDDSYISLVEGVREGRNLYEKIRIMIFFYLAINLAEGMLYFSASIIPDFYIISSWQRIYIFSIIHAIPIMAILFGPSDKNIMKLKPRDNDDIIPRQLFYAIIVFSSTYVLCLAGIYAITYYGIIPVNNINSTGIGGSIPFSDISDNPSNMKQAKARTMMITIMYLTESFVVLSIRRINRNMITGSFDSNIIIWLSVFAGPIFHFIILYNNSFAKLLNESGMELYLIPLSFIDLFIVVVIAFTPITFLELFKWNRRRNNIQF